MHVAIIGGTGHIGSYLTPRLFELGCSVICICRGEKTPYRNSPAWSQISYVYCDRDTEESAGSFGERIRSLSPDAVIDLTCYTLESAIQLTNALRGNVQHLLHCGTIWVHGHSVEVPTTESAPRTPFGDYGIRKAAIERYLIREAESGFPATVLHPGHLVGPGWNPINPQGNFNPEVFATLARGEELALPNLGMETVHHVHADDVARAFVCALQQREAALGQAFHVVSPRALTLRGYAERTSEWLGQKPRLRFVPYDEWKSAVGERDARVTYDHISHSPNCSIEKASALLGYTPRYTSLAAIQECIAHVRP
jgi:nucleoside-diphosphate-sugar epimerase